MLDPDGSPLHGEGVADVDGCLVVSCGFVVVAVLEVALESLVMRL
jgi:hypothetical protein